MAAWASSLHFRVHAACRMGTKLRTLVQRKDEQKWEWVNPKKEAEYCTSAQLASQQAQATCAQTRTIGPAKPKHETASSTGSNDNRQVLPRGSVAAMATCSVKVQTEDSVNGSRSLWDWLTPRDSHFHSHPNAG